jgi:hypothetical protein
MASATIRDRLCCPESASLNRLFTRGMLTSFRAARAYSGAISVAAKVF